jgi:hypothetical protein
MRLTLVVWWAVLLLCGCASPKKEAAISKIETPYKKAIELDFKDQVLAVPPQSFQDTPQSRAVKAGSRFYANANYCEFIRRYRLKTNADFNSAINLFKYRAYFMGAQRIVFVESDVVMNATGADVEIILHPSLPKESTTSVIVGDLYECPTTKATTF